MSASTEQKKICESLLSIDREVIYTAILSLDGVEIATASRRSASTMMPSSEELSRHFKSISKVISFYASQKEALEEGERAFGELKQIIAIFKNYQVLIVLSRSRQIMAALIALKDANSHTISFQVSRILS
jgi:hypothetical protein